MESEPNIPVESVEPVVSPAASRRLAVLAASPKFLRGLAVGIAVVLLLFGTTSFVYMRPPTDGAVRKIVRVLPYPAAVVGNQVISMGTFLDERDALNTYFETTAAASGTDAPTEAEITMNILETLVHKSAVEQLARKNGVTVDESRVDEFYAQAVAGTDAETFATQLQSMFGWGPDEFRTRVVRPVVLATQLGESIAANAERQEARRQKAQAAYDRIAAGEEFTVVADELSQDASMNSGGDIGYIPLSDIPLEWQDDISALQPGDLSPVIEGEESFMVFKLTDRTGSGDTEQVRLSLVSVPKETLDELVEDYLATTRVWKLIGRT